MPLWLDYKTLQLLLSKTPIHGIERRGTRKREDGQIKINKKLRRPDYVTSLLNALLPLVVLKVSGL